MNKTLLKSSNDWKKIQKERGLISLSSDWPEIKDDPTHYPCVVVVDWNDEYWAFIYPEDF